MLIGKVLLSAISIYHLYYYNNCHFVYVLTKLHEDHQIDVMYLSLCLDQSLLY